MNPNPNVAAKIHELLRRIDKLTTADKMKPAVLNLADKRRAAAMRQRSPPTGDDPFASEQAWLDDSF